MRTKIHKKNLYEFSSIIFIGIISLMLLIYILWLLGFVQPKYEIYARFTVLGGFLLSSLVVSIREINRIIAVDSVYNKRDYLIIVPFIILLVSSIFHKQVGIYGTALFIFCSLFYFFINKRLYEWNKVFYFLIIYLLLMIIGTIGTEKGFHFPERAYTFFLLPITFSFFQLSSSRLIGIGRVFFRIIMLFIVACFIYWWYNYLYINIGFIDWISNKLTINIEMPGWMVKLKTVDPDKFHAYYFVNFWAGYYHPSYISLVLFFSVITGFFLYYKQDTKFKINSFELSIFLFLSLFIILLMQSRVGIVIFILICFSALLYYIKFQTQYFKLILALSVIGALIVFIFGHSRLESFINDGERSSLTTIAVAQIENNLWWGVGTYNQKQAIDFQLEIMKEDIPIEKNKYTYVHNQFLGNMVQFGLFGLVVLLIFIGGIVTIGIKKRSFLLQMYLLVLTIFMLIEEPLYTQEGITRCTIFLVFFATLAYSDDDRKYFNLDKSSEET